MYLRMYMYILYRWVGTKEMAFGSTHGCFVFSTPLLNVLLFHYRTVRVIARHGMNVLRLTVARYMPLLLRTWNFFRYEMAICMYGGLYMYVHE